MEEYDGLFRKFKKIEEERMKFLSKMPKEVRDSIIEEKKRKVQEKREFLKKENERELTKEEREMLDIQMKLLRESIEYDKQMELKKKNENNGK